MNSGCSESSGSGGTVGGDLRHQRVPPVIAPLVIVTSWPVRCTTTTLDTFGQPSSASSTAASSGRRATPVAAVGRHDDLRARQSWMRSRRDSAENPPKTTLCGAPIRAQASIAIASLGDQRHVDRDAVALLDAQPLEHVRELADFAVELPVGEHARVAGLALPDDARPCCGAAPSLEVAVEAVVRGVELAADEPFRERRASTRAPSSTA